MRTQELYQSVTKTIIDLLEAHQLSWDRPWISFGQDDDYARNPSTGRYYRGINQFLLSYSLMQQGYLKNQWMTFAQIKQAGGLVLKGEKSLPVVFYKTAYVDQSRKYYLPETIQALGVEQCRKLGIDSIGVLKQYRVFNVAQTQGLPEVYYEVIPPQPLTVWERMDRVEALLDSTGAQIDIREFNQAYYSPREDKIVLPLREQFKDAAAFAGTAFHELGHWTGHPNRLNRAGGQRFGDAAYSQEELICELGSAFLCASVGITKTITNHAAYIQSWLGILKEDPRAIVGLASQAQKIADYVQASSQDRLPELL